MGSPRSSVRYKPSPNFGRLQLTRAVDGDVKSGGTVSESGIDLAAKDGSDDENEEDGNGEAGAPAGHCSPCVPEHMLRNCRSQEEEKEKAEEEEGRKQDTIRPSSSSHLKLFP